MKDVITYKQGQCPYCESYDIDYGSLEVVDECVYYPAICCDCGEDFKEWYTLNYSESIGDKQIEDE